MSWILAAGTLILATFALARELKAFDTVLAGRLLGGGAVLIAILGMLNVYLVGKKDRDNEREKSQLRSEIANTNLMAKPAVLSFRAADCSSVEDGLIQRIQLESSKKDALGPLEFQIKMVEPEDAKLISVSPNGAPEDPKRYKVTPDGKSGLLKFTPLGSTTPIIQAHVNKPCIIEISGNYLEAPFQVRVRTPSN